MTGPPSPPEPDGHAGAPQDRLESWKEIAAYLRRDVTTVQRWERREGMPVHRHLHDKLGSVHAFRSELDAWAKGRRSTPAAEAEQPLSAGAGTGAAGPAVTRSRRGVWTVGAVALLAAAGLGAWQWHRTSPSWQDFPASARFAELTDFAGTEQAAAISRDGKFAAFLADRDGRMDVWLTQIGTGRFYNLTRDAPRELVNPSIRTLGFSPDGTLVTFWARRSAGEQQSDISIWAVPVLGGTPALYLEGAAEYDWTADGTRLVYHTPGPGDPMFVREAGQRAGRRIFSAAPGVHAHFPVWSPGGDYIYFVQGTLPDRMDIWRVTPAGGPAERLTHHETRVSHPVFVDGRSLLYLATDSGGSGPWLHGIDVERRQPRRLSAGFERYTSLAASADGRALVATVASRKPALVRMPVDDGRADPRAARRISLSTGSGTSPRLGPGYLLYVSSREGRDSIWKLEGQAATELWNVPGERLVGAPALAPGGRHIAFSARRGRHASLYVGNADGTNLRTLTSALDLQGGPAWSPDGESLVVAAAINGTPGLFRVPLDGGRPTLFVRDHALDPVWAPDGRMAVYSGPDIGTSFQVKAVSADGKPHPLPRILSLSRGARRLVFLPGSRSLAFLHGELTHKNLFVIDLNTGADHPMATFEPRAGVRDFDISPDGRELVVEQIEEHSDIVLMELPPR